MYNHYNPQVHLKRFSHNGAIWQYNKITKSFEPHKSTKRIGGEEGFYLDSTEKSLEFQEDKFGPVLKKLKAIAMLKQSEELTVQDISALISYLSTLITRTPRAKLILKEAREEISGGKFPIMDAFGISIEENLDSVIRNTGKKVFYIFKKRRFTLLTIQESKFIFPDNGFAIITGSEKLIRAGENIGLESAQTHIYLPLTKNLCLILDNEDPNYTIEQGIGTVKPSSEHVELINGTMLQLSDKFAYAADKETLEGAISSAQEIMKQTKAYRSQS